MIKATYQIGVDIIGQPLIVTHYFKRISYVKRVYENWELHDFLGSNHPKVTLWRPINIK